MVFPPDLLRPDLLLHAEQFLFHEARLLDERRWDAWLDLFTADGMYWAPLERGQTDAKNHVSLFYEGALLRSVRARRLNERNAWSQQPAVQTQHLIGNIQIDEVAEEGALIVVRSAFQIVEWHRSQQRILAGAYTHRLRHDGADFKIALKRIDLVNCNAVHDAMEIFL
jgi:benzoate/toluate 1,2-dioxygenase beta subunit